METDSHRDRDGPKDFILSVCELLRGCAGTQDAFYTWGWGAIWILTLLFHYAKRACAKSQSIQV